MIEPGFWKGRRVFLTGHTGFKGSWLTLWLESLGAQVSGFSLLPDTDPNLFTLARVAEGMDSRVGDIRDARAVFDAMRAARPEVVIHMAAQPLVRHSYAHPVETYATNVMGTVHVLEAVRQVDSIGAVVVVTSDKCYENREGLWGYRENDPMGGYDPYSSSKGCAELVTAAYRSSYAGQQSRRRVAVASARAGNVIGGGDWAAERLVPDMMRAVARGEAGLIRSPEAIRPWQHVLEPLGGYLLLAQHLLRDGARFAEAWNFGPEDSDMKPVQWVVERVAQRWGEGASWKRDTQPQPHEAAILKLDCAKARARLGWIPRWGLAEAIDRSVDWYRAARRGEDMRSFSLAQIGAYAGLEAS